MKITGRFNPSMSTKVNKKRKSRATVNVPVEDGATVAVELRGMKTCDRTKKSYAGKIKTVIAWFELNKADALDANTRQLKFPMTNANLLAFFGHLCSAGWARNKLTGPDQLTEDMDVPLSVSTVQGYRSAVVDRHNSVTPKLSPFDSDGELAGMLDGYEKLINNLKLRGLMSISEGKRPISGSGYGMLAEKFMKAKVDKVTVQNKKTVATSWSAAMFGWTFFVLMWNLMSRSDSVDTIMLQHIDWEGDCLRIEEQGHKGDLKGENKFKKHIYANPLEPAICPILSLAVLIFCSGFRPPDGRQQLFVGTDSKGRFAHQLHELVHGLCDGEKDRLGCAAEDIGTHSERKGSSTYCLGQVAGPTPVSVFLRMGQSLGALKDRYIFAGEGADQLCGRMVCGLPYSDENFGVLPPHFDNDVLALLTREIWNEIVPGYDNYPTSFRAAFPFLLASLFYHEAFLRANLRTDHPLWTERVFSANRCIDALRGKAICGIGACPRTGLKASGIPPHLAIAAKLKDLTDSVLSFRESVTTWFQDLTNMLPEKIAEKVDERLRQGFVINGVAPLTMRDMDSRFAVQFDSIRALMLEMIASANKIPDAPENGVGAVRDPSTMWWKQWTWNDGQIAHFVPPNWEFPGGMTVKKMWDLWHYGDQSTGIRPYRLISRQFDVKKKDHMRHTRALKVMNRIISMVPFRDDGSPVVISQLSLSQGDVLFETAYSCYLDSIYDATVDRTRKHELSYATAYQLMVDNDPEGLLIRKRVRK